MSIITELYVAFLAELLKSDSQPVAPLTVPEQLPNNVIYVDFTTKKRKAA